MIENASAALKPEGLFIANLDLANITVEGGQSKSLMTMLFRNLGIEYSSRRKILKKSGYASITFNLEYLGADDTSGPNYSGQDAVTSYYRMI